VIDNYTIIGEFHFNNYYRVSLDTEKTSFCCIKQNRENGPKSTQSGINGLKELGYRVHMITGDALVTAEDIGRELDIVDEKTEIINGEEFINKSIEEQDDILLKVFSRKGNVIFGRTKAEFKGHIVERFQKCGKSHSATLSGKSHSVPEELRATLSGKSHSVPEELRATLNDKSVTSELSHTVMGKKVIYGGDQENDYHAIKKANIGVAQEGGNKKCKNIANLEGEIPTETIYKYLSKYRTLGIQGKAWFYKELIRFNYITAGIWLVGITTSGFEKINLLFIEPWSALMSLIMSIAVTLLCMYRAFRRNHIDVSIDDIVYYTPMKSLFRGLIAGYILYLSGLTYQTYSIPLITGMMIFLI